MKLIDLEKINLDNSLIEIITDMINQPTVNAIPVKWIEEWIKTCIPHYDYDKMTYIADVYEMLEDWEKENE